MSDDLQQLYKIFLGRAAEAEALDGFRSIPIGEVAAGLACSQECGACVLQAIVRAAALPHEALPAGDEAVLDHWLDARLALRGDAVRGLGGPAGLLYRVFGEPTLAAQMEAAHGPLFLQAQERLQLRMKMLSRFCAAWMPDNGQAQGALLRTRLAWDASASAEDRSMLYLAVLGRPVESQIFDGHQPAEMRHLIRDFACSSEMDQAVLHALVQQRELPHERLAPEQLERTSQWLTERLALPEDLGAPCSAPVSILRRLFSHPSIAELMLCAHGGLFDEASEALRNLARTGLSRFRGRIEFVNREFVAGFLVDVAGVAERPLLEVRSQGRVVCSAAAGIYRPDIQLHFGGDGLAGFRAPWSTADQQAGSCMLTLHEAASGLQVGPPYRFDNHFLDQLSISQQLAKEFDAIQLRLDALASLVPNVLTFSAFAPEHHDLYRRTHRVPPPAAPGHEQQTRFTVFLDASDATATAVRTSIDSLRHQKGPLQWQLWVIGGSDDVVEVAHLLGTSLPHVRHAQGWPDTAKTLSNLRDSPSEWVLLLHAGEMLDSYGLSWLHAAHFGSSAAALYWDEDRLEHATGRPPGRAPLHVDPIKRSRFDPDSMLELNVVGTSFAVRAGTLQAAAALIARHAAPGEPQEPLSLQERERLVWAVASKAAWQHIPHFLSTRLDSASAAGAQATLDRLIAKSSPEELAPFLPAMWEGRMWRRVPDSLAPANRKPLVRWEPEVPQAVISVLIPTKDQVALLRPCIDSLIKLAAQPRLIEITVADNGSTDPETLQYLDEAHRGGAVRLLRIDEPFNWSRLNNQMAASAKGKYLVFLNNDTRMLTREWDQVLRGLLERPDVGAVGARLLYEDMTIQHAGIVFSPHRIVDHDQLGKSLEATDAYMGSQLTHAVAGATGACLATTADSFARSGGFDEESLSITFNDVDWNVRLRKLGMKVIYSPLVSLIHLESKSRGFDFMSRKKQARADYELGVLLSKHQDAFRYNA